MKKVLFVVGSLRSGSFNAQFAKNAEKVLEGKAEISYLDWSQVPVFSQDLEANIPAAVQAARQAVSKLMLSGFSHLFTTLLSQVL